jgi:hypothetical protein
VPREEQRCPLTSRPEAVLVADDGDGEGRGQCGS